MSYRLYEVPKHPLNLRKKWFNRLAGAGILAGVSLLFFGVVSGCHHMVLNSNLPPMECNFETDSHLEEYMRNHNVVDTRQNVTLLMQSADKNSDNVCVQWSFLNQARRMKTRLDRDQAFSK